MADNSNNKLLVVLDKYKDRASELVVVTSTAKNRKSVEGAHSASTMDMKTFVSKTFSAKMFVNIFDGDSEEWLWEVNPKISHIHAKCVELWGQPTKEEPEIKPEEEETVEESVGEPEVEEETPEEVEIVEEESEEKSETSESESIEEESEEEPEVESEEKNPFAAARQATANRKSSTTPKPSIKKADSSKSSKKVDKPSKKATELDEDLDEEEEIEESVKKSGGLIWVLAIIALAIISISIYLALKPGRELETLGLTAQYSEATNRLNEAVEPAWYRWESWNREVAAEATLEWGPYFRSLYITGEGANPTSNSIQLYAVYLTLESLVDQGLEPGEALRVIREDGSETIVTALKSGNISSHDINFIKKYLMK